MQSLTYEELTEPLPAHMSVTREVIHKRLDRALSEYLLGAQTDDEYDSVSVEDFCCFVHNEAMAVRDNLG